MNKKYLTVPAILAAICVASGAVIGEREGAEDDSADLFSRKTKDRFAQRRKIETG